MSHLLELLIRRNTSFFHYLITVAFSRLTSSSLPLDISLHIVSKKLSCRNKFPLISSLLSFIGSGEFSNHQTCLKASTSFTFPCKLFPSFSSSTHFKSLQPFPIPLCQCPRFTSILEQNSKISTFISCF